MQTLMAIQNIFLTPTVIHAFVENGMRLKKGEKVDPEKHDVRQFLSVFQGVVTDC